MEELGNFVVGVVLDALSLAVGVFVLAFPLLPDARQPVLATEGDALLETVLVLGNDDAIGTQHHGALDDDHVALEYLDFLRIVDRYPVGLELHRLVAVGALGEDRLTQHGKDQGDDDSGIHFCTRRG